MDQKLNENYQLYLNELLPYIHKIAKDNNKAQILQETIIEQLIDHQNKYNNAAKLPDQKKDYVYNINKSINYKKQLQQIKKDDQQKYSISTLIIIMCGYIVVLFFKEFLNQNYLIHFYVDSLVAIVAFYVTLRQILGVYHLIKKYEISLRPLIVIIAGFVLSLFVTFLTYTSPFDITFLLIVIALITSKRIYDKEMV